MPLPLIYIFHPYIRYIYNYYIVHIIACSTSSASAPRHSPTITRFGLMRSAVLIRSRIVIGRTPSVLAFLVSNRTKLGLSINCSSAESSIVIIRSSLGINCDNAFKMLFFRNLSHRKQKCYTRKAQALLKTLLPPL